MLSTMLGKLFMLALLFSGEEQAPQSRAPLPGSMPVPTPGSTGPTPWPQALPTDLPPFPAGWEYDVPPPPEVVARAQQLLGQLWQQGEGAIVQEQTGGRWITYRAEIVAGGVKGVTAWRVKAGAAAAPVARAAPSPAPAPSASAAPAPNLPAPLPPPYVPATFKSSPSTAAAPTRFVPVYTPPAGGMTTTQIQTALNAAGASPALATDGSYGPLTAAAVSAFQRTRGLTVDGKAGPLTQAQLLPYLPGGATTARAAPAVVPVSLPRSVPTTATVPFVPVYTPPAGGMSVSQIQNALNAAGAAPALKPDGSYGPLTRAAVIGFQADHGLKQDGMAGALTQQALKPYLTGAVAPSTSAPSTATAVPAVFAPTQSSDAPPLSGTQIQTALNAAGAMPPLSIDGSIGPKSIAAIKAFQTSHGLAADGSVGPLTTAKLRPYLAGMV